MLDYLKSQAQTVEKVLSKTYKTQYHQIKVIEKLYQNNSNLMKLINKNKKYKWSNKIKSRPYLDKFYVIPKNISKSKLKTRLRSTITKKFKPYVDYMGLNFIINNMRTYVIAEAGVNHNGNLNLAFKLVDKAKKIKADCVKFQLFKHDNLATRYAPQAAYQKKNTKKKQTQLELLKKLELKYEYLKKLKSIVKIKN